MFITCIHHGYMATKGFCAWEGNKRYRRQAMELSWTEPRTGKRGKKIMMSSESMGFSGRSCCEHGKIKSVSWTKALKHSLAAIAEKSQPPH